MFVGAITLDVADGQWPQPLLCTTYSWRSFHEDDETLYFLPAVWTKPLTVYGIPKLQQVWLAPLQVGTGSAKETLWVVDKNAGETYADLDDMDEEYIIEVLAVDNGIFRLDPKCLPIKNKHGELCLPQEIIDKRGTHNT